MELLQKQLGPVALDLAIKEGKFVVSGELPLIALMDALADKVKAAIPGKVDDAIIDLVMSTAKAELMK